MLYTKFQTHVHNDALVDDLACRLMQREKHLTVSPLPPPPNTSTRPFYRTCPLQGWAKEGVGNLTDTHLCSL